MASELVVYTAYLGANSKYELTVCCLELFKYKIKFNYKSNTTLDTEKTKKPQPLTRLVYKPAAKLNSNRKLPNSSIPTPLPPQ